MVKSYVPSRFILLANPSSEVPLHKKLSHHWAEWNFVVTKLVSFECKTNFSPRTAKVASSRRIVLLREWVHACATSTRSRFASAGVKNSWRGQVEILRILLWAPFGLSFGTNCLSMSLSHCTCVYASLYENSARAKSYLFCSARLRAPGDSLATQCWRK